MQVSVISSASSSCLTRSLSCVSTTSFLSSTSCATSSPLITFPTSSVYTSSRSVAFSPVSSLPFPASSPLSSSVASSISSVCPSSISRALTASNCDRNTSTTTPFTYIQCPDGQSCAVPSSQAHLYYLQLYGLPINQLNYQNRQMTNSIPLSVTPLPLPYSSCGFSTSTSSPALAYNVSHTSQFCLNAYYGGSSQPSSLYYAGAHPCEQPSYPRNGMITIGTIHNRPHISHPPFFYSTSAHLRSSSTTNFANSLINATNEYAMSNVNVRNTFLPSSSTNNSSASFSTSTITVSQSSFLSSSLDEHQLENSDSAKKRIESKKILKSIKEAILQLEIAVEREFNDFEKLNSTVQQCEKIYNDVTKASEEAISHIDTRSFLLIDCAKKYKELTAECLPDCSNACLDEISDLLSAGLQSATIALSRRQIEKSNMKTRNDNFNYFYKSLPEPNFISPIVPITKSNVSSQSEVLCTEIIDNVEKLRSIESRRFEEMQQTAVQLEELQAKILEKNQQYAMHLASLENIEKAVDIKATEIDRLSGIDDCAEMTVENLQDLCRLINKSMRKIATEQAIREIRATNSQGDGLSTSVDKEACVVCFEKRWNTILTSCGHFLCDECSQRLNYCPTCRTKITGRQKCFQP